MPTDIRERIALKGLEIDERTGDYIRKRMGKLDRYFTKVSEILYDIELCLDKKGKFWTEIMVETPYKKYRIEEMSESVEGAVDVAVDRLKVLIVKDKNRIIELKKRGARSLKKKVVLDGDARFRK